MTFESATLKSKGIIYCQRLLQLLSLSLKPQNQKETCSAKKNNAPMKFEGQALMGC
jgi:hypothetical protein